MSEGRQEGNKLRLYLDGEFRPSNKDVLTAIPDPYTLRTQIFGAQRAVTQMMISFLPEFYLLEVRSLSYQVLTQATAVCFA